MQPSPPRTHTTGLSWLGFLALVLLQMADLVTTVLVLHAGGHEWNPLMALVLLRAGYSGLVATKAALTAGTILVFDTLYSLRVRFLHLPRLVLVATCGWLWLVCCLNTHMLLALLHR
jgi:hypothetical protein